MTDLLTIEGLRTTFRTQNGEIAAVDNVDLSVAKGRTLGIVGEFGCGKSILSLSVMRLVPPPGRIAAGRITFDGRNLLDLSPAEMRGLRGNRIAMIFQEPMTSLNPVFTVGRPDHRGDARARPLGVLGRTARPRDRGAGPCAHSRAGAALRRIPAPDVGRHAPAGDDRDGAGLRAGPADRRRTHHRAGCHRAGADPGPAARLAAGNRHGNNSDHARSWHRRRNGRRGRGDVRRPRGRTRAGRRRSSTIRSTRIRWACSAPSRRSRSNATVCWRSRAPCRRRSTCHRAAGSIRAAYSPMRRAARRIRRCGSLPNPTASPACTRPSRRWWDELHACPA